MWVKSGLTSKVNVLRNKFQIGGQGVNLGLKSKVKDLLEKF